MVLGTISTFAAAADVIFFLYHAISNGGRGNKSSQGRNGIGSSVEMHHHSIEMVEYFCVL